MVLSLSKALRQSDGADSRDGFLAQPHSSSPFIAYWESSTHTRVDNPVYMLQVQFTLVPQQGVPFSQGRKYSVVGYPRDTHRRGSQGVEGKEFGDSCSLDLGLKGKAYASSGSPLGPWMPLHPKSRAQLEKGPHQGPLLPGFKHRNAYPTYGGGGGSQNWCWEAGSAFKLSFRVFEKIKCE